MAGRTFTQLKAMLGDWLNVDTVRLPDSVRGDMVNMKMREFLRRRDLWFGETSGTLGLTANLNSYPKPVGWSRTHTLWYKRPDNNDVQFLTLRSKERFDMLFSDPTKAMDIASDYTVWGSNIFIGPTPTGFIPVLNHNYYKILDELVSGSNETNSFTDNAWEAIFWGAMVDSYKYLMETTEVPAWIMQKSDLYEDILWIEHTRSRTQGKRIESQEPGAAPTAQVSTLINSG